MSRQRATEHLGFEIRRGLVGGEKRPTEWGRICWGI